MREGGGDREGAGAQELGRRVSQLAEPLSRSSSVVRLPARRRLRGSSQTRPPFAPTQAARPSLGPTPPPGAGRWRAAPRSGLRLLHSGRGNFRPHRAAQRPTLAAEGTAQARAEFQGPSQAAARVRGHSAELRIVVGTGETNGSVGK